LTSIRDLLYDDLMSEPGGQDLESTSQTEAGNIDEQLRLLQERTPSRDQLTELMAHLADDGMVAGNIRLFDLMRRVNAVYEGQPVTSDPDLPFGLNKLAQSTRVVNNLLNYNRKPADGTIPEPLTRPELRFLVHNLLSPVQGSKETYTPQQLKGLVDQVLADPTSIGKLPRACGLRALTRGALQRPPQRP
jgi:hypothetical protein